MIEQGEMILSIHDEFNNIFATHGWIAHDMLNVEAACKAMAAAKQGEWKQADELLAESYTPFAVRLYVKRMSDLNCFKDRMQLALRVVEDYEAQRYHACVPVALALIDGMGQQLVGSGFFRKGAQMDDVSDSFLEIGPGFSKLIKTFCSSRKKTVTEEVNIPYRHGILHGIDLCYGNKIVAAKALAALVAAGCYARKVEKPLIEKDVPGILKTLRDYSEARKKTNELKQYSQKWQPRSAGEIETIITQSRFSPGTSEYTVVELLTSWQNKRFGPMAEMTMDIFKNSTQFLAGKIKKNLGPPPSAFSLKEIDDCAPASSWVSAVLQWDDGSCEEVRLRLLCMKDGETAIGGTSDVKWFVHSLWPLEVACWNK
jgi:hypothetical protein